MVRMNSAAVMSTSSAALNSTNSLPTERLAVAGASKAVTFGAAPASGGLNMLAAQRQQHGAAAGKIEFDADLLAIAAARRDEFAVDTLDLEHIGGESQASRGCEGRGITERIDAVRHEHDIGTPRIDQRAHRSGEGVRIELLGGHLDRHDLIDAGNAQGRREAAGLLAEDRDGDLLAVAAQRLRRTDEFQRHRAQFAAPLFCDYQ